MKELLNIVNSKLQTVIDELKTQKETLDSKVKTVGEDIDKKVAIASQYKEEVEKSNNIITELEAEINKLKKDLRELHEKFDSAGFTELLEAGNKEINGKVIEHNTKISEEQDNIKKYQEEAANLKEELTSLKESKANLETELNNTIIALNYYSAKIDEIANTAIENADKLSDLTVEEDSIDDSSAEDVDVNKEIDGTIFEEIDGIATGGKEISEEELNDILSEDFEEEKEVVEETPVEEVKEETKTEEVKEEVLEEQPEEVVETITEEEPVENNEVVQDDVKEETIETKEEIETIPESNQEEIVEEVVEEPTEAEVEEIIPPVEEVSDNSNNSTEVKDTMLKLGFDPNKFGDGLNNIKSIDYEKSQRILDTLDVHFIDLANIYTYPQILVTMDAKILDEELSILEYSGCLPSTINSIFNYLDKVDVNKLKELIKGPNESIITTLYEVVPNLEVKDIGSMLDLTGDQIITLQSNLDSEQYNIMCTFPEVVVTNYNTLKDIHVDDINKCFTEHPKRFLYNPSLFESILDKYDPQDLVRCINKNPAVIDKL